MMNSLCDRVFRPPHCNRSRGACTVPEGGQTMRKFQPTQQKDQKNPWETPQLPLEHDVAIYPRQSTMKQVGNVATEMQTDDLIAFAKKYGWAKDKIIMYREDLGVSG